MPSNRYILTFSCPDRPGIVHAVSGALLSFDANIVESSQFGDTDADRFCIRVEFDAATDDLDGMQQSLRTTLAGFGPDLTVRNVADRPRVLILVSKFDHCLVDLLYRWRSGQLQIDIPLIASNHPDCAVWAARYDVPYAHLPVTPDTKPEQEAEILRLVDAHDIDLVVLARYMQVLSNELCSKLTADAINIHHSFLPGFKGAKPYHQAHERGVKLIGATAHFVTPELDEGPIIEQDVVRVDHAHTPEQLAALGRDVERVVLARAVKFWSEDRILTVGHKTVVFS